MADFNNLALTFRGVKALLEAQAGAKLILSKIGLGSGTTTSNIVELTGMVMPEVMMPISEKVVEKELNYITLIAKMTNEDVEEGFYWRETGLFFEDSEGNDVLFAYACVSENNKYDYVPAYSDQRYVKHVRVANVIADGVDVTIKESESLLYVDTLTFEEFKIDLEERLKKAGGSVALPDISTDTDENTTILNTILNHYAAEIKSGRFYSAENVQDNPEANAGFGIEFFDIGKSLILVRAYKINTQISYFRQIDCETSSYVYEWIKTLNNTDVVDNLESTSTNLPLSAKQGNVLKGLINKQNENFGGVRFGFTEEGKPGVIITDEEGADSVLPFIDTSNATATAAMLTEGYTAWVNGELIIGTRPTPTNTQSGSQTWTTISWDREVSFTITFPVEFDEVPSVSLAGSSCTKHDFDQLKVTSVTRSYFTGIFEPGGTPGMGYSDVVIRWTASVT